MQDVDERVPQGGFVVASFANSAGVMVSKTSICPTSVFKIFSTRLR